MLTLNLEPEIETRLKNLAKDEHLSTDEMIKQLVNLYANQKQAKQTLLTLMSKVPSSVSLANELLQERRLEANIEQQGNA